MGSGLLEEVVAKRCGEPIVAIVDELPAHCWNPDEWDYATVLYQGMKWNSLAGLRFKGLKPLYGNSCGGFLVKNALKVAHLLPGEIYGIWNIEEMQSLPIIQHALVMDPAIEYFMDNANVWYYGEKLGELYVFDAEMDDIDCLGPLESALQEVFDEAAEIYLEDEEE